jgi:hypothetical protein
VAALVVSPPWFIAPEDNLTWTHTVELHQRAAHYMEEHYAGQRVLTAWPASDELSRPFLGYVSRPLRVVRVENYSAEETMRAAAQTEGFDVVLAISTKYVPPRLLWHDPAGWRRFDTQYFDYHQDLDAEQIARLMHGRMVWRESVPGAWAAVIEVEKIRNAGGEGNDSPKGHQRGGKVTVSLRMGFFLRYLFFAHFGG